MSRLSVLYEEWIKVVKEKHRLRASGNTNDQYEVEQLMDRQWVLEDLMRAELARGYWDKIKDWFRR